MNKTLEKIADIKAGYLFKERIMPKKGGNISIIQLKDIDAQGVLCSQNLQTIFLEKLNQDDLLRTGDVLLKAKTNHPIATVIGGVGCRMIATAHYFVIRLTSDDVTSGYLAWYLNQMPAQNYFSKNAGGAMIQVINKRVLSQLEIVFPDIGVQKRIEKIYALNKREQDLVNAIKEKKQKFLSAQLLSIIA